MPARPRKARCAHPPRCAPAGQPAGRRGALHVRAATEPKDQAVRTRPDTSLDLFVDLRDYATTAELGYLADGVAQVVTIGPVLDPRRPDEAARRGLLYRQILDVARLEPACNRPPEPQHGGSACDRSLAQHRRRNVVHIVGEQGKYGLEVAPIERCLGSREGVGHKPPTQASRRPAQSACDEGRNEWCDDLDTIGEWPADVGGRVGHLPILRVSTCVGSLCTRGRANPAPEREVDPTFLEFFSDWFEAKKLGIAPNTELYPASRSNRLCDPRRSAGTWSGNASAFGHTLGIHAAVRIAECKPTPSISRPFAVAARPLNWASHRQRLCAPLSPPTAKPFFAVIFRESRLNQWRHSGLLMATAPRSASPRLAWGHSAERTTRQDHPARSDRLPASASDSSSREAMSSLR
jgi:hypothetical protein